MTLKEMKLEELADQYGYDNIRDLVRDYIMDSRIPAICMNDDCDYTYEYEPDCTDGWCEGCSTNSVRSVLVLYDFI